MTDLGAELHRILETGEVLMASQFSRVLFATGYNAQPPPTEDNIEAALVGLVEDGLVDLEFRRGKRYFRVTPAKRPRPTHEK